jgi:hypothetical protein
MLHIKCGNVFGRTDIISRLDRLVAETMRRVGANLNERLNRLVRGLANSTTADSGDLKKTSQEPPFAIHSAHLAAWLYSSCLLVEE